MFPSESGVAKPDGNYSLGVLTGDFNGDGLTDIYVASDQTPSILYINQGNGTFVDEALLRGVALDDNGKALSGMGVAAARLSARRLALDLPHQLLGRTGNALSQPGQGRVSGRQRGSRHGAEYAIRGLGMRLLRFRQRWLAGPAAGERSCFSGSGPAEDRHSAIASARSCIATISGRFVDISETAGPGILERHSSRGLAFADYDNDGARGSARQQSERAALVAAAGLAERRTTGSTLKLEGTKSNRSAIGARVRVTAGGMVQTAEVRSGGSYLSQSDLRLHFGLGAATKVDRVEIAWPGGGKQVEISLPVDKITAIRESAAR